MLIEIPTTTLATASYALAEVWKTDQNQGSLRQREYTPLPFPSILTSYVLATQWRRGLLCSLGAIAASLSKPSFVFAHDRPRRASSAHSYPLPHVDRHLSDSAALDRLLRCPYRVFTPSPLTSV
eukprot:scaffold114769_cov52-Phaeocystis_antarctica.AAC.1